TKYGWTDRLIVSSISGSAPWSRARTSPQIARCQSGSASIHASTRRSLTELALAVVISPSSPCGRRGSRWLDDAWLAKSSRDGRRRPDVSEGRAKLVRPAVGDRLVGREDHLQDV